MSGARARFAIAAVAVLALVGSLGGMSLLLARDALPGDALYGFKRTAEAASLGLTFNDESKALKHLDFASARISEIETLARRYPDGTSAPVGGYLTALADFDNDASAGSRQLIALATRAHGGQLDLLGTWAGQQSTRLSEITLPASVRGRAAATTELLAKIAGRAEALRARMDCYQITSGSFDDVGALPARGECQQVSGGGASTTAPGPGAPGGTGTPVRPTDTPPRGGGPGPEEPTPLLPPLPGVGSVVPGTSTDTPGTDPTPSDPDGGSPTIVVPLPLPSVDVPPLLPGLPGVRIGQ